MSVLTVVVALTTCLSCRSWVDCICALAAAGTIAAPIAVGQSFANGGAGQSGGDKYIFEYGYNLSKRTELTFNYAKTNNDRFSNRSVGGNSDTANFGESQTYFGGRISHRF